MLKEYSYIRNEIKKLLNPDRYKHSLGVEKEAVKLGKLYGADIFKCRIAAIAHDCQKNLSDDELINKAKYYGIEIDRIQREFPQLLHGPVGAMYCREYFDIDDKDILNSVYYHTTGREGMSLLEKIIYLSDVIEESRYFSGIELIRKEALVDINRALILSGNSTLTYVIKRNYLIHPLTVEFRNSLLLKGGRQDGKGS